MGEVDHLIQVLTPARAYYPPERADGGAMDIGETRATRAALGCLRRHCELVKGSTGKEVLEVFYQEVGFRLIA
jgi:recyclin-1